VPAREPVQQQIPIVNGSDKEWVVRAKLDDKYDKKLGSFDIKPKEILNVKKQSSDQFCLLTIEPEWACTIESKLTLKNDVTNEEYEYELKGYGEEPLAKDHIVLHCRAREKSTTKLEIPNRTNKTVKYTVTTDLQRPEGESSFSIPPTGTYEYELSVTPILGGTYTASITFMDEEEKFYWWTVEVITEPPKPIGPP
jgi:hypothetical protein